MKLYAVYQGTKTPNSIVALKECIQPFSNRAPSYYHEIKFCTNLSAALRVARDCATNTSERFPIFEVPVANLKLFERSFHHYQSGANSEPIYQYSSRLTILNPLKVKRTIIEYAKDQFKYFHFEAQNPTLIECTPTPRATDLNNTIVQIKRTWGEKLKARQRLHNLLLGAGAFSLFGLLLSPIAIIAMLPQTFFAFMIKAFIWGSIAAACSTYIFHKVNKGLPSFAERFEANMRVQDIQALITQLEQTNPLRKRLATMQSDVEPLVATSQTLCWMKMKLEKRLFACELGQKLLDDKICDKTSEDIARSMLKYKYS